jgi:hypothetical protein
MTTRHKPDHEIQLMLRVLRDLQALPKAGRYRVLAYWNARADDMPETASGYGEQQMDIEDALPPLHVRGAAA